MFLWACSLGQLALGEVDEPGALLQVGQLVHRLLGEVGCGGDGLNQMKKVVNTLSVKQRFRLHLDKYVDR